MELVLFKDLLDDDAEPQYGLLEDRTNRVLFVYAAVVKLSSVIMRLSSDFLGRIFHRQSNKARRASMLCAWILRG